MRVISRKRLREFAKQYPDAAESLEKWEAVVREGEWRSLQELRVVFPNADGVEVESEKIVTVFNIRGNRYRLITAIHYNTQRVYVLLLLTHAEYSKELWKENL